MAFSIDTSTDFGKRVKHLLEHEQVAWLTTVDGDGRPFPSVIWFLYEDDGTLLIYSRPNKPKLRNIASNAAVSINFNTDEEGEHVVILDCAAVIDESTVPVLQHPGYLAKYHEGILSIDMTDESFSEAFSVAIRVIPQNVRGF
jgi:PPOX class probable F420-dependent enzyme